MKDERYASDYCAFGNYMVGYSMPVECVDLWVSAEKSSLFKF